MGVVSQLAAPLLWTASIFILGFLFQIFAPSVNEFLISNTGLIVGQLLSIVALLLNFTSQRGRSDMADDFDRSTIKKYGILEESSKSDQNCQVHKLALEDGAMSYSYGYTPVEQWHRTDGFRQAMSKSFPNVEKLLPNSRFTKNGKPFFNFVSCEECRNEYSRWVRIAGFEPHDCAILQKNLAEPGLPDVMDRINWDVLVDDHSYVRERGEEAFREMVKERMLPRLLKKGDETRESNPAPLGPDTRKLRSLRKEIEKAKGMAFGGKGNTLQDAVVIEATDNVDGILTEYRYIGILEGKLGVDWVVSGQSLINNGNRSFDKLTINCRAGGEKTYYFDVTSFIGTSNVRQQPKETLIRKDISTNPNFVAWIDIASETVVNGVFSRDEVETIRKLSVDNDTIGFAKFLTYLSKRPPIDM